MEHTKEYYAPRLSGIWLAIFRIFYGGFWLYQAIIGDARAWPVAILLLLGLFTPLAAIGGFILAVSYYQHSGIPAPAGTPAFLWSWGPVPPLYWVIMASLLTIAITRAGRALGLDSILSRRWPGLPVW